MIRNCLPGARDVLVEHPLHTACLAVAEKSSHRPRRCRQSPNPSVDGPEGKLSAVNTEPDQPVPAAELPGLTARRPGILVADDEAGVRALLGAVLDQQGFVVWGAATGLQALELYQAWGPDIDLVLLDVRMPGLDGPQTWARLRQLNAALCGCFMTGDTGDYTPEELLAQGAVHVFRKPFQPFEVAATLHGLLNHLGGTARGAAARSAPDGVPELLPG